jgi:VanZ family protein
MALPRPRWLCWPFWLPLLVATAIIATAPFMGLLRDAIFTAFPRKALGGVAVALGAVLGVLMLAAIWRIRQQRVWRYAGLLLVGGLLYVQVFGMSRGVAEVDVVERIHIVEYGTLAWLIERGLRRREGIDRRQLIALPLLWTALAGTLDESAQLFFLLRIGDIRDVGLNTFAGVCGLLFAWVFQPPAGIPWRVPGGTARILRATAISLFVAGLFFYHGHLGYLIADPEVGTFRSYWSAADLPAAGEKRRLRWRHAPPSNEPWRRKDLFVDEAARQTTYRNERNQAGDLRAAWLANRILEKYYAPFLELDTFRSFGSNRWLPEHRVELERRFATLPPIDPARYRSPVLAGHLVAWPKGAFLAVWLSLVALAAFFGWSRSGLNSRRRPG